MVFQNMQCYGNMHTNSIVSSMFAKVYRRVYSKVVINKILVFFQQMLNILVSNRDFRKEFFFSMELGNA